jgi:hypothetical protein
MYVVSLEQRLAKWWERHWSRVRREEDHARLHLEEHLKERVAKSGGGPAARAPDLLTESGWRRWLGGGLGKECRLCYAMRMSFVFGCIGMLKLTGYTEIHRARPWWM